MAAIGTRGAQDLIDQATDKGYTADDAQALAKQVDGRDLEYLSKSAARRVAMRIGEWPTRDTADALADAERAESTEPMATAKQVDYLASLYRRFATEATAEQRQRWAQLTRRQASQLIDEYKTTAS